MEYNCWYLRNGALIIEQYKGVVNFEKLAVNESEVYDNINRDLNKIICFSDLSQAEFEGISESEISKLLEIFDSYSFDFNVLKLALYTGSNNYKDFQTVMLYAEKSRFHSMSAIPFNTMDMALSWLDLSNEEIEQTKQLLKGIQNN